MTVVGLAGFAQSGKTTAALYLEKKYGIRRKHIAEPLRAMLAVLLQANGMSSAEITEYLEGGKKEQVIPCLGVTSRYAQITIGTEWGRELISQDLWANTWGRGIAEGESVMNDSVRFPNEAAAIRKLGGVVIMIKRPGTKPAKFKWGKLGEFLYDRLGLMWGVHDSERIDRIKPDFIIHNDSSVEQLYADLDAAMVQHYKHKVDTSFRHSKRSADAVIGLGLAAGSMVR
ncbi:nucleoside/nucleotide kinase family protein [Bradyrhizobium elkanii]